MDTVSVTVDDVAEDAKLPGPHDWNDDGVVILKSFLDPELLGAYEREWTYYNGYEGHDGNVLVASRPGGWPDCTPYMRHEHLRRLVCNGPLGEQIAGLIGEPAGVHLNLTGWVSTERNWHQDTYLNPPHVGDHYAAVWIALGDIDPRSGPFQYIPGSHRWFTVTREKIGQFFDLGDPAWPKHSEEILTDFFTTEIARRKARVVSYLPKRGDVLIWHGRLVHRGSVASVSGAYRPALIAHYSGIHHRQDMPAAVQHKDGGWFFPLSGGPV